MFEGADLKCKIPQNPNNNKNIQKKNKQKNPHPPKPHIFITSKYEPGSFLIQTPNSVSNLWFKSLGLTKKPYI